MMGSSEKLNYSLRPAKQIERKMICESLRRLSSFASLESYRYVGFGSFYFKDFVMMHRDVGIKHLVSIEKDKFKMERYKFNIPYSCIQLEMGDSNTVIPDLEWRDVKTILWLDYDSMLSNSKVSDIKYFARNACSGSVLIVTLNVHMPLDWEDPEEVIKNDLDTDIFPIDREISDFRGWRFASLCRKALAQQIKDVLDDRNYGRDKSNHFVFQQVLNFYYQDGAKMLTFGGVLFDEGERSQFESCQFGNLPFIRKEDEEFKISVPNLTQKEILHLGSSVPTSSADTLKFAGIPARDLKAFAKIYRYFPNFAEIEA